MVSTTGDALSSKPKQADLPSPIEPSFIERLDKDFVEYYNEYLAIKPATHGVSIEDIRATPQKFASPWYRDYSFEPFVNDLKIKSDDGYEFTARCYSPDPRTSPFGAGPYPAYINFHGASFLTNEGSASNLGLIICRRWLCVWEPDW